MSEVEIGPTERTYISVRAAIMAGEARPGQPLKPQELATAAGVSLAAAREALLRLTAEGLADRLPNRGFIVPAVTAERWWQLTEARSILEPAALRLAVARGDLEWEARVRAAHHRLARTAPLDDASGRVSDDWSRAHHAFHRALLEGSGNEVLLEGFERHWTASELLRRWSVPQVDGRDFAEEHRRLEQLALARDADGAAAALAAHVTLTLSHLLEPR
jgi:DNA-binding GntR family transcriptional regulator